jgi:hypothetical protein
MKFFGWYKAYYFCLIIMIVNLISGCSVSKNSQCQQIFQIANHVSKETRNLSLSSSKEGLKDMKIWLQAADLMNKAAEQLQSLSIEDARLIEYQNKLAQIYHLYSQATYDAVNARETKNIEALKSARHDAEIAGKLKQESIEGINRYCRLNK